MRGSSTSIEKMAEHGVFFLPTKGDNNIDPGIQLINDYLRYDDTAEISDTNHPKLQIFRKVWEYNPVPAELYEAGRQ